MFIAKVTTRYPDFHGKGYYNFLMEDDELDLDDKVQEYDHDFSWVKTVYVDMDIDELMDEYPTKDKLNEAFFV